MTEAPPRVSPHHIEADRSRPEPRCDVGVLLVHGIGDHKEGETLTGFGEPLLDWIRAWLRKGAKDADVNPVSLSGARLRAARNEAESPAYAEAVIRDRQEREERWLLCEAWWGEAVRPPELRLHFVDGTFHDLLLSPNADRKAIATELQRQLDSRSGA